MPRALFLFLTFPLFAQFSGLATTDDGSQLYFSSSLQLNGATNENAYSKIFRYDNAGIHFVAQVDKVAITPGIGTPSSNPYNLTAAYVSGDGGVFGYVGIADCENGAPTCYYPGLEQTTLQPSGNSLPYGCTISKNARYAACITGGRETYEQYGVFDLSSPQKPIYSPGCGQATGPPHITSDGRALCGNELWSQSGETTLAFSGVFSPALISDDGSTVVLPLLDGSGSIARFNVATGVQSTFYQDPQSRSVEPISISKIGAVVLFTVWTGVNQVAVIHADGTGFLQLTNEPAGVSSAVLSGDGSIAFVVTANGKLVKLDTTTGASALITTGAQIQKFAGAAVAGSLTSIQGLGLADATLSATLPLPTFLGGVQVTVNGTPAPVLAVSPAAISFQIPWETPLGNAVISVVRPSNTFVRPSSAFVQAPIPVPIRAVQPFAILDLAISEDFSRLIGTMDPANPGDIVNFYLTGLGATTAAVADGALSPSSPLPSLVNPVTVLYGTMPVQVLYAGLAPGTVGVYQLTIQLPLVISRNPLFPPGGETMVFLTLNSLNNILPAVWATPNQ